MYSLLKPPECPKLIIINLVLNKTNYYFVKKKLLCRQNGEENDGIPVLEGNNCRSSSENSGKN